MELEVQREYVQDALTYLTGVLRHTNNPTGWRRYKVAEVHASRGGVDIGIERSNSTSPPYALAKAYLQVALMNMEPKGDNL